jgi:hypothetical protein
MYGLTRATTTLLGAALAGVLIYLGIEIVVDAEETETAGEFWSSVGLFAVAGFVMALSQLLGGWTKWGWPRISWKVFLIAFLPVLVVTLWIVLAGQPEDDEWLRGNILDWSDDIGLGGLLDKLLFAAPVIVFGAGLVLGLTLDTSGPRLPSTETVITAPPRRAEETAVAEESRPTEAMRGRSEG